MPSDLTMGNILTVLFYANRPISTQQVAKYLEASWKTARDNLEEMYKLGMVERGRVGKNKRIYWRTDSKILDKADKLAEKNKN